MIPIQNLYYLLCYAWNRLDEKDLVDVNALPRQDLPNLLARVLATGTKRISRQGLHRGYVEVQQDTRGPRGKINVEDSVKRSLFSLPAASCVVDEFSTNVLPNRILKATICSLQLAEAIDETLQHELALLVRRLSEVPTIELRGELFRRVQLHRNNSLLKSAQFLSDLVVIDRTLYWHDAVVDSCDPVFAGGSLFSAFR